MTIAEAQKKVDQWIQTIGIRYFNELTNTAILMEEVGEVARLMARIYGEQSFKTKELESRASQDLAQEMGDVLFVLICLANQTGVDLGKSLEQIMEKRTIRDQNRHKENQKINNELE